MNDSLSAHQKLHKCASPSWKQSYRRRCHDRLKRSKAQFLQRFREQCDINNEPKYVLDGSTMDDILRSELDPQIDSDANFDDIIKVMEEIKMELMIQEREILLQHDRLKDYENGEIASAILDHESRLDQRVLCPICSCHYLEKIATTITCRCGIAIDVGQDSITLEHVALQLKVGVTSHAEKCVGRPIFGVVSELGDNLLMTCDSCDFMFIVI